MIGSQKHSRVSVSILDATQVSLDGEEDASVSSAAVLQQGGGGLPGALRDSAVEGSSWKRSTGGGSGERVYSGHVIGVRREENSFVSYRSEGAADGAASRSVLLSVCRSAAAAEQHLTEGRSLTSEPLPHYRSQRKRH